MLEELQGGTWVRGYVDTWIRGKYTTHRPGFNLS
jgi:hypothetical protein